MSNNTNDKAARWRLILGRFADKQLSAQTHLDGTGQQIDDALNYLYGREYSERGVRDKNYNGGSLDASQLTVPDWLNKVRKLFPKESIKVIEKHAIERYGMTEMLTDAETLKKLEPNQELLKQILTFKGQMKGPVLQESRLIIKKIIEEIKERLESEIKNAMSGKLNRFSHSPMKVYRNLDWKATIKRNLKNYDMENKRLVLQDLKFFSRVQNTMPWNIVLCVDQSGSMLDSVIHSAVMAGILCGLPMLTVKLVVFDTAVVDLSKYVDDPVETLMSVQLGGGTNIGKALAYCETLLANPSRSIVILVSDFEEGGRPVNLLNTCKRLHSAGVKQLGLASLDDDSEVHYDHQMAEKLSENGMKIAALSPKYLAEWLAGVIS